MSSYRFSIIVGNVGADPTLQYTDSGVARVRFNVAVNEVFTRDGQKVERVYWHSVTCWRQLAEICAAHVKKGMLVMVTGTLDARAYLARSGEPQASLDMTARDVRFLSGKPDAAQPAPDTEESEAESLEDIPF